MSQCSVETHGIGSSLWAFFDWSSILGLVFGGCCWNVFALEAVLKEFPHAGIFLTFAQFAYVTIQTASTQITFEQRLKDGKVVRSWIPRLRPRVVPLRRWLVQVVLFLAVSLLNNFAFSFKVPVPVHIIFRSGGLCVSMAFGYLFGKKRYSGLQVTSVCLVTAGILLATVSAPPKPKQPPHITATETADDHPFTEGMSHDLQYALGITLLCAALLLSAVMGLWQEGTYRRYGAVWREGLFYSHLLSLPFFFPFHSSLSANLTTLSRSPPVRIPLPGLMPSKYPLGTGGDPVNDWHIAIPSAWIALATNVVTQGLCIRGVNRLTARVSSVSVNLILTVRKAVSLLISVVYYGSGFNLGLTVGAGMVLVGTVLYSVVASPTAPTSTTSTTSDKKVEPTPDGDVIGAHGVTSALQASGGQHVKRRPVSS